MALSVANFYQPANWNATGSAARDITGVAWSAGDIIVIVGGTENAGTTLGNPTNANLTIGVPKASVTVGGGNEATCYVWASNAAASSQTAQTIAVTISNGLARGGIAVWVITGSPTGVANAAANNTEAAFTVNTSAGSVVVYGFFDWSANTTDQTLTTGSGTPTERMDWGDGVNYGGYGGEWVGVSAGSQSWGVTSYTGTTVAHAVIEVLAPAGAANTPWMRHRKRTVARWIPAAARRAK
jgi:hypothetical protein